MLKNVTLDGEYFVNISGQGTGLLQLPIYCHGMNTKSPIEYLTLPSGGENNFVVVSDVGNSCNNSNGREYHAFTKVALLL